ncbi:c-type cytochrome [Blastopirellula marina]|uniref:Cytochrome c, class I n=1 Tax=Blastopirellula marina DSM 3645 TaxID=314230 RepID=A3ZT65_9BACT|nr:c-type cytochrome [Blastopirellula marina]EAQ80217.1 Cytochrome c, class I [Blastopirellula marina DSM 3645]
MPANESIWRNIKTMHFVFAVSSIFLLVATIIMFAQDHMRQWKPIQRKYRSVEATLADWQINQQKTEATLYSHHMLETKLLAVKAVAPSETLMRQFQAAVNEDAAARGEAKYDFSSIDAELKGLQDQAEQLTAAKEAVAADDATADQEQDLIHFQELRANFLSRLDSFEKAAKFREETLLGKKKFRNADLDAVRSRYDLAIRDELSADKIASIRDEIAHVEADVAELGLANQHATAHRKELIRILGEICAVGSEIESEIKANQIELNQLVEARSARQSTWFSDEFPFVGKRVNELPILDAFNSSIKIDQIWLPELKQDFSHKMVARFDRCMTCHMGIDKTQRGSPTKQLFPHDEEVVLTMSTPSSMPEEGEDGTVPTLESVYGIRLASEGLLDPDLVTIELVLPESLAAQAKVADPLAAHGGQAKPLGDVLRERVATDGSIAGLHGPDGLKFGDVIVEVGGNLINDPGQVRRLLMQSAPFGDSIQIKVSRGLEHPYASHPRLDLFVGSLSPHEVGKFGCTICHDGQGNATDFKWASHTPNSLKEMQNWKEEYGWFDNHFWLYPMHSQRFVESSCIKCHHDVVSLEASEQFPEPPAPKVVEGYHAILKFGCFGCHEVKGNEGHGKTIGPDLRLEPNYFATAQQLLAVYGDQFDDSMKAKLAEVVVHPEDNVVREDVFKAIEADKVAEEPQYEPAVREVASQLKDQEAPGELRKVGPSLRYVASKLEAPFLYDWIRKPSHFRPDTKMPQFFGLWSHLDKGSASLEEAEHFEPIEILGIVQYLTANSQKFEYLRTEQGQVGSDTDKITRGKLLFETRGCLACHQHEDFPASHADQGPNLTGLGGKLRGAAGRQWLYTWLKDPTRYHVRTKMPNLFLDPVQQADGTATDPAEDVVAFLLSTGGDFEPTDPQLTPNPKYLDQLTTDYLGATYNAAKIAQVMEQGIAEEERASLKGAEVELIGGISTEKKLQYIGRKAIGKYGCYACHDVPGFEDFKPIGTALTDWGRKDTSKLAFEHINEYLHHHMHPADHSETSAQDYGVVEGGLASLEHPAEKHDENHAEAAAHDDAKLIDQSRWPSEFYLKQIGSHSRIGFIEQKLREPRSYDYKKTENKSYNDRLRMPQFPFENDAQREAIITFVLGLVAQPPAPQYVYTPTPRKKAMDEGRVVLEKYNCKGCHIVGMEKWDLTFQPGFFEPQATAPTYPYVEPHFSQADIDLSQRAVDAAGNLHATIVGLPAVGDRDGLPIVVDDEGYDVEADFDYDPARLSYRFQLWDPVVLDGNVYPVGLLRTDIPADFIRRRYPTDGGALTKMLLPRVLELEQQSNPNAKGSEAWAWLPPPLVGQGKKAQVGWMHDFLLDPYPIRPAVVLRMPKFNMTSDEAGKLANFFAARDDAEFPYAFDKLRRADYLRSAQAKYDQLLEKEGLPAQNRLTDAMGIIVNSNYCVKCHIVGDFVPVGSAKALAPDLTQVYSRLRPRYVRDWISQPSAILPYTAMPVNIPYLPDAAANYGGIDQKLYHGTSFDQIDALTDLLMNYDEFAKAHSQVTPLVEAAAPPPPEAATGVE